MAGPLDYINAAANLWGGYKSSNQVQDAAAQRLRLTQSQLKLLLMLRLSSLMLFPLALVLATSTLVRIKQVMN
jgi:hypothetical protein